MAMNRIASTPNDMGQPGIPLNPLDGMPVVKY